MTQKTSLEKQPTVGLKNGSKKTKHFPFQLQYDPHKKSSRWWIPLLSTFVALLLCAFLYRSQWDESILYLLRNDLKELSAQALGLVKH